MLRLTILLAVLIIALSLREEGFAQGDRSFHGVPSVPPVLQFPGTGEHKNNNNACKKQHTLKWDSQVQSRRDLNYNPWAKDCGHHCRSDTNCKSGKCNGWYCISAFPKSAQK